MNGERFVLDSNFILDYLKALPRHIAFMKEHAKHDLRISIITEMELFSFPRITEADKEVLRAFLTFVKIIPLNEQIKNTAISFRCETRRKLPDSIIAATAISLDSCLITSDDGLLTSTFSGFIVKKP